MSGFSKSLTRSYGLGASAKALVARTLLLIGALQAVDSLAQQQPSAAPKAPSAQAAPRGEARQQVPTPLVSNPAALKTPLTLKTRTTEIEAAIAGTCTVIDALIAELCLQTPQDPACPR